MENKQALEEVYYIVLEFDKEGKPLRHRPITFDFNTLVELSSLFIDPLVATMGIFSGDPRSIRGVLYSALMSGQLYVDENVELDLTPAQVGRLVGELMVKHHDKYEEAMLFLLAKASTFLPKVEEKEESQEDKDDNKEAEKGEEPTEKDSEN